MTLRVTLFFLLLTTASQAQILSDSTIRVNNIYRVTTACTTTIKAGRNSYPLSYLTVETYNRKGKPIKYVNVSDFNQGYEKESSVTMYFYNDTLLSKTEWKAFNGKKLVDKGVEKYEYTFDSLNRKTSELMRDVNGRTTKEVYIWNSTNSIDEIHYFSNDSAVYVPTRKGYDFLQGQKFQLNKTIQNYRNSEHRLVKTVECKIGCRLNYINDGLCCTTTEFVYSKDTTYQKIKFYNGGEQTVFAKQYTFPSGALYDENERGDKSITFYHKNKRGLLIRSVCYSIEMEGIMRETVTTYRYEFYRR